MDRLAGPVKHHDWGSTDKIPAFTGQPGDGRPWAEQWFGAHPLGPAVTPEGDLPSLIARDPGGMLGASTRFAFGDSLPYLVKLIAPARALSLQVHPGRSLAAEGFARESRSAVPVGDPNRVFQDTTHKPEMLYALTPFEALVGFCVRRQAGQRLEGLDCALATRLSRRLRLAAGRGVKPVVSWLLDPEDGPTPEDVAEFAAACQERLLSGHSPEEEIDQAVVRLQQQYPGDPSLLLAFLMNSLQIDPGEALFIPTRTVHSYQSGLGLEVMANSDNVIRAGLTSKHVDRQLFLDTASFDGVPPTRIAPEQPTPGIHLFRSPVEDFELTVADVGGEGEPQPLVLPGTGPRTLVGLRGQVEAMTRAGSVVLAQGQAAFVPDSDGPVLLRGTGALAQVSVP